MSCIKECNKKTYYNVICDYTYNNYIYSPNLNNTCKRDTLVGVFPNSCEICQLAVDCCANTKNNCCKRGDTRIPTSLPTLQPTQLCNGENTFYYESNSCYFFEKQDTDISKNVNDQMICCSNMRSECCVFKKVQVFTTMGVIILIIFSFICYSLVYEKKTKIHSENKVNKITPI